MKKEKPLAEPTWYKNTYFWIGGALLILSFAAMIKGEQLIRDPGQLPESHLPAVYFVAGALMLINGFISHAQTKSTYTEYVESSESNSSYKNQDKTDTKDQ